jgi:hypothetical protein
MAHPDGEFVFKNILSHLEVVGTVWNTQIFLQRLNDAVEIVSRLFRLRAPCGILLANLPSRRRQQERLEFSL